MPFDPTQPYEPVARSFDPAQPFERVATPAFDPSKPFDIVRGEGRDTSRDSFEAQREDVGVDSGREATTLARTEKRAALQAEMDAARKAGDRADTAANAIDFTERYLVEPLTRPLSGVLAPPLDTLNNAIFDLTGRPEFKGQVVENAMRQPVIDLPRAGQAETATGKVAAGAYNAAAELLAGLTSPDALALLPAAVSKPVLTAWISQMAAHAPERLLTARELFQKGDTQGAVQQVVGTLGELGLAEMGRRHVMGRDTISAKDVEGQPQLVIDQSGGVVDPARPDLIARNLAAPGTVRPTEQRAMASPLEGREKPAEVVFDRVPVFNAVGEVIEVQRVPRIREIQFEEPQLIETLEPRRLKEDVEGGKLGFGRTAEDFIRDRSEPERPAGTIEPPRAPEVAAPTAAPEPAVKPGLISGTQAEFWADRMIAEGQKRLNTGLDPELFAAYVVKGAAHLERGVRKFSEWAPRMIAEHGEAIRPHLQRIFEEAQSGLGKVAADEGVLKQRKLAARGSVSPEVPKAHQERLKTGREAFYEPQDMSRVEDVVTHMTSEELASVPMVQRDGPNNVWTAAQLELYRRNVASGNLDAAWQVMDQAMRSGTALGQLVNQFKMLRGATPEGVLVAINKRLAEGGFDPMRPGEQMRVRRLSEESIKANAKWKESERVYRQEPTPDNFERVKVAREDAVEADVLLQQKVAAYEPRAFGDLLTTLLKGNLLAPISQAANIIGNTSNLLIRGQARGAGAVVDTIDSMVRGRKRTAAAVPLRGAKEAARSVGRALPESWQTLWKGASDAELSKADVQRGLRPLVAMRDLFKAQIEGPQKDGKTPFAQRMMLALEASPFAMHATAQLRLLGAVDKPFKAAARARLITEAMRLTDMKRAPGEPSLYTAENVKRAVEYPELFLDAETLARIENEAAYAVYQGRNLIADAMSKAMANAKPGTRFMVATIAPFVRTPTNVIGEWMSYNPAIAGINVVRHAMKGDTRQATQAAGKFVAGSMMLAAGYWLYQKGLISPSLDQADEQQKARILAGMTLPPHHINLSGLERALKGGSPAWQKGDRSVDVLRAGGVAGALMLSATDVMRQREREPAASGFDLAGRVLGDQWTQMLQYGVNQSFLKGTANLLEAIQDGKMESWAAQYVDTLTAIPLPGTLNALARATREFKPEVRGDALDQRLENQIRSRLGAFGADDKLPLKRDLWGRPIREAPEGSTPWLYHTLDVSKAQRIPSDDLNLMLYGLWRKTGSNAVLPTPPDANLTIARKTYQLTQEELSRLREIVGEQRRSIAERVMLNDRFINLPPESKVAVLQRVWSKAAERGSRMFYRERGATLTEKGKAAGFAE